MQSDNSINLIGKIRDKANQFLLDEMRKLGMEGVAPSHGEIIMVLFQYQELAMTEIATKIGRDRSTVTALVQKLYNFGYTEVRQSPEDSRSTLVFLTQKGKALETGFYEISAKMFQVEYQGVTEEERAAFLKVLKKILANFSQ